MGVRVWRNNRVSSGPLGSGLGILTVAFLLPLTACVGPDASADRAGVGVWRLEEVFSVGTLEGEQGSQFGEVSGVDVDDDGNVYIADRQARNVRVFNPLGLHVRTIGRAGSGPGEFGSNIDGVFIVGHELLVPDLANQRVSRFDLDGSFRSAERLDMAQGVPIRWDVASEGRLIAQRRRIVRGDSIASTGDAIVTVGTASAPDTLAVLAIGQSVQITGGIPKIRQFAPEPVWDTSRDGRLVTGVSDAWRFEIHGADGGLQQTISRPFHRRPVTERDKEAVAEGLRQMYRTQGVSKEVADAVVSEMEFAESFPTFVSVVLGPNGSLWVQNLASEDEPAARVASVEIEDMGSTEWGVFGADGHYLGSARFPVRFRPIRVKGDRFYGIALDELDVQSVKAFRVLMD
jgi:6-bladed beta-propeller